MDAVSDPAIHTIVIMSSAQIGKTEVLNNIAGYFIDQDPSPMLFVMPTMELAEAWSKDRLDPMIRDSPGLAEKISPAKAKSSGNTIKHKTFAGGRLTILGANAPAKLASRNIRVLLCDEVDKYPASAGKLGDPVNLAKKRTTTFWNRKIILVSTPGIKGASRIERAYEGSDKRVLHLTCEDCGGKQSLNFWDDVKWDKDPDTGENLPDTAYLSCRSCGSIWDDATRDRMVANVEKDDWIADKKCDGIAGFWINELYSPWVKVAATVRAFLESKSDPEEYKQWTNEALGETWDDAYEKIDPESLMARREPYGPDLWPEELLLVTAGVDTQDDRLEARTWGFGADEEKWRLQKKVFFGDPGSKDLWDELDDWLKATRYNLDDGRALRIEAACVDSGGHYADQAVRFCANKRRRRIFAIKGMAGHGKMIWNNQPSRHKKNKRLPVHMVAVDPAKSLIFGRLNKVTEPGPRYLHFSEECEQEDFDQLTSEKMVVTKDKTHSLVRAWVKIRERNEELDCAVYAYTAYLARGGIELLKIRARRSTPKEPSEVPKDDEMPPEPPQTPPEPPKATPKRPPKKTRSPRRKRGGFVNDW